MSEESNQSKCYFIETLTSHGYTYLRQIGSGGFSKVHLIHHIKYGYDFAVKQIEKNSMELAGSEVQSLLRLSHPGIVEIFEVFDDSRYTYLVFEHCENGTLHDMISKNGSLTGNILFSFCSKITSALQFCHNNGVAHLDIKPENIFIDKYFRPKIGDFGLSQLSQNNHSISTVFSGSPCYQSPQIISREPFNPFKSDIWSLGCTFYFLATGTLPFYSRNLSALEWMIGNAEYKFPPNIDLRIMRLIRSMLKVEEEHRAALSFIMDELNDVLYQTQTKSMSNFNHFCTLRKKRRSVTKCASCSIWGLSNANIYPKKESSVCFPDSQ